jgi:hypothetical protein
MSALATVLIIFGIINLAVFVHSMWKEICLAPKRVSKSLFLALQVI